MYKHNNVESLVNMSVFCSCICDIRCTKCLLLHVVYVYVLDRKFVIDLGLDCHPDKVLVHSSVKLMLV